MNATAPRSAPEQPGIGSLSVRVGCEFHFASSAPSPSVLQVQPHPGGPAEVQHESWTTEPRQAHVEYLDLFGNRCHRMTIPEGTQLVRYDAVVRTTDRPDAVNPGAPQTPLELLPSDSLQFTLPSRYCLSDIMAGAAADIFGDIEPGWGQVQAVCQWVHEHLQYTVGSSTALTDATDVYMSRQGVCRDFAHLAITFCRALNYPARYAFGYLPLVDGILPEEGMDFAAWAEVFIGGEWYTFDPRNNQQRTGRVLVGRGRDAVDVAMVTSLGYPQLISMTVHADA